MAALNAQHSTTTTTMFWTPLTAVVYILEANKRGERSTRSVSDSAEGHPPSYTTKNLLLTTNRGPKNNVLSANTAVVVPPTSSL